MPRLDKKALAHFGAEFLVIFVSVVLALVADDWRDARTERREAESALRLVVRDLRSDSSGLEVFRRHLQAQDSAAQRFEELLDVGGPGDELDQAAAVALNEWNYRLANNAYEGLRQSGRLDLIPDTALRNAVISYHDEDQPYLADPQHWTLVRVSSLAEIRADREFLGALGSLTSSRRWLDYRIGQIFLPENERLKEEIQAYLHGAGR